MWSIVTLRPALRMGEDFMKKALTKLVENAAALVNVKTGVTFALVGTLCILSLRSNMTISQELFTAVLTAVITYFFTKKTET